MTRIRTSGLLAISLLGCHGGDEGTGPDPAPAIMPGGATVSSPVPRATIGAAGTGSLVFVAMEPASLAGAARAMVRGQRGDSARALVQNGGFDPLPIAGEIGEVVTVSIVDSGGGVTERHVTIKRRPTRVVRTTPLPSRTDVPLNTRISVVFSAPVDSASALAGVSLWKGGLEVPGETRLTPGGLAVEFVPTADLAPGTDYELRAALSIRDVLGAPIAARARAAFRTGNEMAPVGTPTILGYEHPWLNRLVSPVRLAVGQSIDLYTAMGGQAQFRSPIHWTSSDPAVVGVTERAAFGFGIETGIAVGRAFVRAQAAGVTDSLLVEVWDPVMPPALVTAPLYVDRYSSVWRMRADGSEAVKLLDVAELPPDPTLCEELITEACAWFPHMFAVGATGRVAVTRISDIGGVWVRDGAGAPLRQVNSPAERGAAHSPAWSPNGDQLAYWFDFSPDGVTELRVVNYDGTGERVLARVPFDHNPRQPGIDPAWAVRRIGGSPFVWHPDGQRLLVVAPEGTVQTRTDGSGTSPYLAGYQPGPWFPGGHVQFVVRVPVNPLVEYEPFRVYRATDGVVDVDTGFDTDNPPIDVSPDGLFFADWGSVFRIDRTGQAEVTGYAVEHLIGFAR